MPLITQGKTNVTYLLIVVVLALLAGGGILWWRVVLQERESFAPTVQEQKEGGVIQESPVEQKEPAIKQEDVYNAGFYLNRDLKFSFHYPTAWILDDKVIDKEGNLDNLTFYIGDPLAYGLSQEFLIISVTRKGDENLVDWYLGLGWNFKRESKQFGILKGDLYSTKTSDAFFAVFIATLNDTKYGFILSVPAEKERVYLPKFEKLISTVKTDDQLALSLPEYFRDNLAMDKRISQPTYIPGPFSAVFRSAVTSQEQVLTLEYQMTYEKQSNSHQEWNYSLSPTGGNNLNIYVQKVGAKNDVSPSKFVANLDKLLEEPQRMSLLNPLR